jgi:hypothetical protein
LKGKAGRRVLTERTKKAEDTGEKEERKGKKEKRGIDR